ncbi:hypothetical protein [Dyella tabacisoli]|uniref:Uncharacterized protein n=1 Tax=Dyella tabacisoli TaxID=2282381 RepID=A0A369UN61_9GAMM|nr:hypothetical protein [Dyella tabacisoli]RDD82202.1 hypothetical protein DVJ77_07180 [Dyella tabacisoli]
MVESRNLILGAAAGYAAKDIRLFLRSLALVGFNGRLVLFVYQGQMASIRTAIDDDAPSVDVQLVRIKGIREHAKFMRSCIKRLYALAPAETFPKLKKSLLKFQGMPHVTRYFHYDEYLSGHPGFSNVLLTDVRDVVFQADPFVGLDAGLSVGMETDRLTIATEHFDRDWILDAYGEAMLQRLGDRQVSCSGVTMGAVASVQGYIAKMLHEIMSLPFNKMKTRIYDQAFHNKLLHCGELPDAHPCQPFRSRIATVGCMQTSDFVMSADGRLLNEDGQAVPIVHQYDRHPALESAFTAWVLA